MANGAAPKAVEIVLDERRRRGALDKGRDGDLIVVCVDHANDVWKELQRRQHGAASGPISAVTTLPAEDGIEIEASSRPATLAQAVRRHRPVAGGLQPVRDLGTLDMRHDRHHVPLAGPFSQCLQGGQAARVRLDLALVATLLHARPQDRFMPPGRAHAGSGASRR